MIKIWTRIQDVPNYGLSIEDCESAVDAVTGAKPKPAVPMTPLGLLVAPELHDRLTKTAQECGTSLSELCRVGLTFYLDRLEADSRG